MHKAMLYVLMQGKLNLEIILMQIKTVSFWCSHGMQIGDDVLFGYGVYLRDDDGHEIIDDMESCKEKSIYLGNHIWCSSNVSVLKGVRLEDDCVVGYNSCLLKPFYEPNLLIGGYPAKVLKKNIQWRKETEKVCL